MTQKAPGKAHREGISLMELADMFPDEAAAVAWFEDLVWPDGNRHCPRCGCTETKPAAATSGLPYYCPDCKRAFSVRIGTALERSKVPLRKWAFAIYLEMTSLKGVSSMKLHRDIDVTQKTAWFMLHRIREAWAHEATEPFRGPVEADETYMGGKRRNMPRKKRDGMTGRGTAGKVVVAGTRDRETNQISAAVVPNTKARTLVPFVESRALPHATVYTDDHASYSGLRRDHKVVRHSTGEYVRGGGEIHTQGIESFWAMLKRAHKGVYHNISEKHLQRYVDQFAGKHGIRDLDTIDQMASVVAGMVGKRLMYRDLVR